MKIFGVLTILAGVFLTVILLPAQQGGGAGPGGGGGGAAGGSTTGPGGATTTPGGGSRPGMNPNTSTNSNSPFPSDTNRPIFLSGKVVLSDGTPLSGPVVIERVCNGTPHAEAYTDSKGRFSFELGQSREIFMDLSEPSSSGMRGGPTGVGNQTGGMRGMELNSCDLRATLAGYRSDLVSLVNHRYLDNPDVGTIVLHKLGNVEGFTTSAISARAPKDARKAYEKGLEAVKKSNPDEAQKQFEKAVEGYPQYATAWFELGRVFEQRDHLEEARKAYSQALAADSKYISPYERLYMLALREGKWQEMADASDRVIHMNPFDFPGAYYFNGVANLQLDKLDAAEKSAREAVKLDPAHRNPKTNYVLGLVLARKREFAESAEQLRAYLSAVPNASDAELVRKQLAQVEELAQAKAQPGPQN